MPRSTPFRVSVVITNHDYGRFLRAAIDSVLAQDHPAVECIVVDDGSTDDSSSIIASYGDEVTAIHGPNLGQGHAINIGFAASTGHVVIFLDADDRLHPSVTRRVVELFERQPDLSRVQIPLAVIDRDGQRTGELMPTEPHKLFRGDARGRLLSCPDDIVWQPTSGNAFARRVLETILPMDAAHYRLCADYHLSSLTPLYGAVETLDGLGGDYRIHGANGHIERTTLDRLRADVERTIITRRSLIRHARSLGLAGLPDDPRDVRSVSHAALRMLSLRLDPGHHPVQDDSLRRVVRLFAVSVRSRRDMSRCRKVGSLLWALGVLVVPRPLVRQLARPVLGRPIDHSVGSITSTSCLASSSAGTSVPLGRRPT